MCCKNFRAYLVGGFGAIGGFLFGYHTAVISGTFRMSGFLNQMNLTIKNYNDSGQRDNFNTISGGIVGILLFGCFVGSLFSGQISDRISRKYSISVFAFVFTIGAALQTSSLELIMFFIGRFVAGVSIGALSMIIPVYHSEIAETKFRGRIITLQQLAITFGIAISFWINVFVYSLEVSGSKEIWRLPLGIQMFPSLILTIGILFCPFSPRWLISRDREDEAQSILVKIRRTSLSEVEEEMNRIRNEVAYLRENEIDSYRQLFHFPFLRPLLLGISIHVLQQLTGINSIMYYAPRLFDPIRNHNILFSQGSLVLTGISGIANFLATTVTVIFIDKVGRRRLLIIGGMIMSISMLLVAVFILEFREKCLDPDMHTQPYCFTNANTTWAFLSFIVAIIIGFAISWGPIPWIYCTEIFPLTMRARAASLTTAANWATNCAVSFLVPIILDKMEYGFFLMFSIFCAIMAFIVYFFYPETINKHLERDTTIEANQIFVPEWIRNRINQ